MKPSCDYCKNHVNQNNGAINRARKKERPIFCNRICSGLGRRKNKTPQQKKEEKRLYDIHYRETNPTLKARKAAYYQKTRDPEKEREKRKSRMHLHVKYCQQPAYREWKKKYDRKYRCQQEFGEFWESASILLDVENEIDSRMSKYEIYQTNGTLNKHQQRRREYERLISN